MRRCGWRSILRVLLPAALLLLVCRPAPALWRSLRSENFLLFYPVGREREAFRALGELEACRPAALSLAGRTRAARLPVVLVDAGTQSNGYADPAYRRLHLYLYPPSQDDLGFAPSWWALVGMHEYVHWLHLTAASGLPGALAWAFGDAWAPGLFGPAWLAEGLAVYAESAAGPYQGRLNSGYFDAYLQARLRAGRPPSLADALFVPPSFPSGEAPYLYGGLFVEYLAGTYGEPQVTRFLQQTAGSALSYLTPLLPLAGLDAAARKAFGSRTGKLWSQWLQAEASAAGEEAHAPPAAVPASQAAAWVGVPVPHQGRVYHLRSLPFPAGPFRESWRHELRVLGPEGERTLARFASGFSADLKLREGRLYFGLRELERGLANVELLGFGAGSVLCSVDLDGGGRERVLRAPLRAYEVLPGGDVLLACDRREDFGSEVLLWKRRSARGEPNPRRLATSDYLVREILVREGRVLVSARRHGENFGMYEVDPATYALSPIFPGPYGAGGMDFTGGQLRFAANYGGRFAVYAQGADGPVPLSSAPYAVSPALDASSGLLWYVGLNPEGFALYREPPQPGRTAVAAEAVAAPPAKLPALPPANPPAIPPAASGGYGPNLLTLAPRLLLPVLAADSASGSYLAGASVLGRSALGDIAWSVTGLVDLGTGTPAAEGSLQLLTPPLAWGVEGGSLQGGWVAAAVELPVFRRLAPAARSLTAGLAGLCYDPGFTGRALQPYLGLGLGWPLDSLEARLSLWVERTEWGAAESLALLQAGLSHEHAFRFGSLLAGLEGFASLQGGRAELEALRGYAQGLDGWYGASANLDFFLRLVQIRAGLWNPPLYLQDVYLVPFAGAALSDAGRSQVSAGLELHWELKALAVWSGLPLDLGVGLAVNAEAEVSLYVELGSPLVELPLAAPRPGRMP